MNNAPTTEAINQIFNNGNPDKVWLQASEIVRHISPAYDFSLARTVFGDVVSLFHGEYPGYCPIRTLYHDLRHTLDVFLCAVRLMHGVHLSGTPLNDDEMTMIMMAALMHDVGYAQRAGEESGTGAQYTQSHVSRSIDFMRQYLIDQHFPAGLATPLKFIIRCTEESLKLSEIEFPDERIRLLGQIVGTADLTGQMADRTYLEKLLFLFLEFEEAHFGNYRSIHDLLRNTQKFYEFTQLRLRDQLGGLDSRFSFHFKDRYGVENNYYVESLLSG